MKPLVIGAVAAFSATAAFASIPPAYEAHLPQERVLGNVEFLTGGRTPEEAEAVKRAAQEWPLEVVFRETEGAKSRMLEDMPVTITDARGNVVFDVVADGPVLLV